MAKQSGDYQFKAVRRRSLRGALVIIGTVLAPPESEPYLVSELHTRPKTRSFRLAFKNNTATVPFTPHTFEHVEPDVPDFVDTLTIYLPNEKTVTIAHGRGG